MIQEADEDGGAKKMEEGDGGRAQRHDEPTVVEVEISKVEGEGYWNR